MVQFDELSLMCIAGYYLDFSFNRYETPVWDTYHCGIRIPRQPGRRQQTRPDERVVCHLTDSRPMRDDQAEAIVSHGLRDGIPDVTNGGLGATGQTATVAMQHWTIVRSVICLKEYTSTVGNLKIGFSFFWMAALLLHPHAGVHYLEQTHMHCW